MVKCHGSSTFSLMVHSHEAPMNSELVGIADVSRRACAHGRVSSQMLSGPKLISGSAKRWKTQCHVARSSHVTSRISLQFWSFQEMVHAVTWRTWSSAQSMPACHMVGYLLIGHGIPGARKPYTAVLEARPSKSGGTQE